VGSVPLLLVAGATPTCRSPCPRHTVLYDRNALRQYQIKKNLINFKHLIISCTASRSAGVSLRIGSAHAINYVVSAIRTAKMTRGDNLSTIYYALTLWLVAQWAYPAGPSRPLPMTSARKATGCLARRCATIAAWTSPPPGAQFSAPCRLARVARLPGRNRSTQPGGSNRGAQPRAQPGRNRDIREFALCPQLTRLPPDLQVAIPRSPGTRSKSPSWAGQVTEAVLCRIVADVSMLLRQQGVRWLRVAGARTVRRTVAHLNPQLGRCSRPVRPGRRKCRPSWLAIERTDSPAGISRNVMGLQ